MKRFDVIVAGGGVIGLLTARELRTAGLSVALLERGPIGAESTRAGGGILAPIPPWDAPEPVQALARGSQTMYAALAEDLYDSTGVDIEYLRCGALVLDAHAGRAAREWADRADQPLESVGPPQLHELEPQLAAHWQRAVWLPGVGQLRNPRLTTALHRQLERDGVTVIEHLPVTGLTTADGRVTGVATPRGRYAADRVVVAAGAWTSALLGDLAVAPIEPVRGQMLWYRLPAGTFGRILIAGDHYLIPRRDGVCLVGSTVERVGFADGITAAARATLTAVAARLAPVFDGLRPAGQWSGLRPGLADGIPAIGAHPEVRGLYVNAGHFRNGINLGPASARLLADLMLQRNTGIDPAPYEGVVKH